MPAAPPETIDVPGGRATLARLLGARDSSERGFFLGLNRVLLTDIHADNEWKFVDQRVELVRVLADLDQLRKRLPSAIEIAAEPRELRRNFEILADALGYKVKVKKGALEVVAKEGDEDARRRALGFALGWDMTSTAERLSGGERLTLEVPSEPALLPMSFADWEALTGGKVDRREPLVELTKDQRLGYLLAARERLSDETLAFLGRQGWNGFYRKAAPLYRYAPAIRAAGGELVWPGGPEATSVWDSLVGTSSSAPAFVLELLARKEARSAHLWHALAFAPPAKARFFLGVGETATSAEERFARRLYRRLDNAARLDFDLARGGDLGFGALVRSVPLDESRDGLALPGGSGLWYVAIRAADLPRTRGQLATIVGKGRGKDLDEVDFVLKSLTEKVDTLGYKRPVLPRLIRTTNMFDGDASLLTPENVVLLSRVSDTYPAALPVLDAMELESPETVRDYLLAVAHLAGLSPDVETEILLAGFQGGVEWLRSMALAGISPAPVLERALRDWSAIHHGAASPRPVAGRQLSWIVDLVERLPEPPAGAPGRGPLEARLLYSLAPFSDPQEFHWAGMDYAGRRGRDRAEAMARALDQQKIPSADSLAELRRLFDELRPACSEADLTGAHSLVAELSARVAALDSPDVEVERENRGVFARILPIHRDKVLDRLRPIAKAKRADKLPGMLEDVGAAESFLARDLRPFLLAPAYLVAIGSEEISIGDPLLIRKHFMYEHLDRDVVTDNPWLTADVVTDGELEIGAQVLGAVSEVSTAMAEFSSAVGAGEYLTRDRVWFRDAVRTRWSSLTPELTRLVHLLVEAGEEIHDLALDEALVGGGAAGPALDFVSRRVPFARLEDETRKRDRGRLVSPSEMLLLGLAALAGDDFGPAEDLDLPEPLRAGFGELVETIGPEWRERLRHAGAATPNLNGSSRPWIGAWPPYEALESESYLAALVEREMLDLKVVVASYLGRHGLPGAIGRDLLPMVLRDASVEMRLDNDRDWEGHIQWVNGLTEDYFDGKLRECLKDGLYRARGF